MNQTDTKSLDIPNTGLDSATMKMAWILLVGAITPLLDMTMTNVALHTLSNELHTSISTIQWVSTVYLLAMGIIIPVSGWAIEYLGGKQTWLVALALFLIGSMLSALSWNVASLIAFRFIQGLGGGLILPTIQTLGIQIAGKRNIGKLMTVIGLPMLLGPILGPVFGGIIVDYLNWRWIFYINVPICLVAIILAWKLLSINQPIKNKPSFDTIGLFLLSPALVAILYGLSQVGASHGFNNVTTIVSLIIGVVLFGIFILYALRKKSNALIDLRPFKYFSFTASTISLFLAGFSSLGAMLLLPLYYQQVHGMSVVAAGLLLIPQGLGGLVTRSFVGKVTDTKGSRIVVLPGIVLMVIGTLPFAISGHDVNQLLLAVALFIRGAGYGAVLLPIMAGAYQELPVEQVSHATSTTRIAQQVGGAFGTSVLAVILQNQLSQVPVLDAAARASAFDNAFWWAIGFTVLAIIPGIFLPGNRQMSK